MVKISVIVCANNEEKNVPLLWKELCLRLKDFELVFVNDGSTDNTLKEIEKINSSRIKVINIPIKKGKNSLMPRIAFRELGEIVITVDADLEEDLEDLQMMVDFLEDSVCEKWDVIVGHRQGRQDTFLRKNMSFVYNILQKILFGFKLRDANCGLKVFRREAFVNVNRIIGKKSQYRFVALLCFLNGYKVTFFPIKHTKRKFGKSHYGFERIFDGIIDICFIYFFKKKYIFRRLNEK